MAEMKKRTETLKTLIDLFKKRIARCERESENLIEAKIDVQQKTFDEEQNNQMLVKELEEMKNDYKEIKSCLELNFLQEKDNKSQVFF